MLQKTRFLVGLAIVLILSIVLSLLGVDSILDAQGSSLDMGSLLVFAAVFGFGGSFISLALSKWVAKRMTGASVIARPGTETEAWLLQPLRSTRELTSSVPMMCPRLRRP